MAGQMPQLASAVKCDILKDERGVHGFTKGGGERRELERVPQKGWHQRWTSKEDQHFYYNWGQKGFKYERPTAKAGRSESVWYI